MQRKDPSEQQGAQGVKPNPLASPVAAPAAASVPSASRRRGRQSRGQRAKLRRNQDVEHVKVEDVFFLSKPKSSSIGSSNSQPSLVDDPPKQKNDNTIPSRHDEELVVGEGAYVTATIQNRRYYGVLIEQAAFQQASLLHFQDEASGIDLNRRMKALMRGKEHQQQEKEPQQQKQPANGHDKLSANAAGDYSTSPASKKRPRDYSLTPVEGVTGDIQPQEIQSTTAAAGVSTARGTTNDYDRPIQKFCYVMVNPKGGAGIIGAEKGPPGGGYRVLLATYANLDAAAEDDQDRRLAIEAACRAGGDFVGDHYYQYEVRRVGVWLW